MKRLATTSSVNPTCRAKVYKLLGVFSAVLLLVVLTMGAYALAGASTFNVVDYGAKGDGATDDAAAIQRAIDAAAASGGDVVLPAGTYKIGKTLYLASDIGLVGSPGQTVLEMAAQPSDTYMLYGIDKSNVKISGLTLRTSAPTDNVSGLFMSGATGCSLQNLVLQNVRTGIKTGSGNTGSGWLMESITATGVRCALFLANTQDSTFRNLNLNAANIDTNHTVYVERGNHSLTFTDCTFTGGAKYCLQFYTDNESSDSLTFNNLTLDATSGYKSMVICPGFSGLTFNNATVVGKSGSCFLFYGGSNVLVDGFNASGGSALTSWEYRLPTEVTFRNGNYAGTTLGTIDGATFENVTLGSTPAPTTTTSSTTSTTEAPTTTTEAPTTTTLPPTTTTSSTTTTSTTTTTVPPTTTTSSSTTTTQQPTTTTTAAPRALSPVVITSPTDGSTVAKGTVTVSAEVDSSTSIGKVLFYVDGKRVYNDRSAPYSYSWLTSRLVSESVHTLRVIAYSRTGAVIGESSAKVTIASTASSTSTTPATLPSTNPPAESADTTCVVTIANPIDSTTVERGAVTVKATVDSSVAVGKVGFYVNGTSVASDSLAPYSYQWMTSLLTPGSTHTVKAVAYSKTGAVIGESSAKVTIASTTYTRYPTFWGSFFWW
ncbi:MAG: hypothetical protein JW990_13450 [Thermoleophilia bacterium]|nr:hypothetical protein [Thermoleophilia bacterium]